MKARMISISTRVIVVLPLLLVFAKVTGPLNILCGLHDGEW